MAVFQHYSLELVEPRFDSNIMSLILDLNHLKKRQLFGRTKPFIFFQVKEIFHFLESIGSARIEGNNTTISEYVEAKIQGEERGEKMGIREIRNIEKAMTFIEENIKNMPINKMFISEIHKIVVEGLPPGEEGDYTPGQYRTVQIGINKSDHKPPEPIAVDEYMEELLTFINRQDSQQHDLLKIALAHHRFVWIHPFANGNGRTVRLFTYAMLIKQGFNVGTGRILNPSAVFCSNRDKYYRFLSKADKGSAEGLLEWCEYVLQGLKDEIEKIDKILDYDFLKTRILLPAINYALERRIITDVEAKILRKTVSLDEQLLAANDLKEIFPDRSATEISQTIRKLKEKNMIRPNKEGGRKYYISFGNNYLMRGIVKSLAENNFLPFKEEI